MPTFEEWRDQINRLARDLNQFATAKNGQTIGDQRPALVARIGTLLKGLQSETAVQSAAVEREERFVGAVAVLEARAEEMTKGPQASNIWTAAGDAGASLDQLLHLLDEIYRLDVPSMPPAASAPPSPSPQGPAATSQSRIPSAPRDTGRWTVLRSLTPGYQGEVFFAVGPPEAGPGVLKRLPQRRFTDNQARVRFLREIAILRRLKHACILRVLDARTTGDDPWLVTEFAPHGCMADHVATLKGDTWRCLRNARDLATALGAGHAEKIVHRDVKPKNVLFFNLDRVAIGDFGIAHDDDATSVTSEKEQVGARGFAPPEWESGHIQPTPAFDVYSLGKLLYYMLAGGANPPRETYSDPEFDLINVLGRPEMRHVNRLLDLMVLEKKDKRLQSMSDVVREVDRTVHDLFGSTRRGGNACRECDDGTYRLAGRLAASAGELVLRQESHKVSLSTFEPTMIMCDQCGDVRIIFRQRGGLASRPEWSGPEGT
jgi:hypothetical protein